MLNHQLQTVGYAKISQGGVVGTIVDKRIVLKYVVDCLATHVILAHNHPSGTLKPSGADKKITQEIKELCDILNTEVIDHVIITADGYYSFANNGDL
jgi:DNA repair protein RadC